MTSFMITSPLVTSLRQLDQLDQLDQPTSKTYRGKGGEGDKVGDEKKKLNNYPGSGPTRR